MSAGTYGTVKEANFNINDAEVWISFRKNRSEIGRGVGSDADKVGFVKVDTTKYLSTQTAVINGVEQHLNGLYQLKLPLDVFNQTGIYNIYIRPRQIEATIKDVGVLIAYPDIRGIVLDTTVFTNGEGDNNNLVGYRIEYKDSEGKIIPNLFRIVTSNNKCEPTNQTTNGGISYRFIDNSSATFLTLSPSSASSARPSTLPFIGNPQDSIVITNTFFNAEMIEIELTENDLESLYLSINGNQIINLDEGLVTTYDKNNNIINQTERYLIKKTATGNPEYEVKENRAIIIAQDYNAITENV